MKKTITINLAGVVFHIEEDAFKTLQAYLDSIKSYFSSVKGGADIQGDIESRIAEIFSDAISNSKQAITQEDVDAVIRQMGKVEDMVDESELETEEKSHSERDHSGWQSESFAQTKRLVRDTSNSILGGVCSGLAAYFEINPLWIRLLTLAFTFGLFWLPNLAGVIIVAYVVLWIAMPGSPLVENKGQFKKFFRSRNDQIVAGVAAGLGKYLSIDPVIIRILFVVATFTGGVGLLAYLIVWAITPQAKSITDELQMQGDPVTLNNIEEQIKKNLNIENPATKNTIAKAAALPVRLLELIINAFGKVFKIGFDVLRALLGVFLLFISGVFLFAILVTFMVAIGVLDQSSQNIEFGGFPLEKVASEISSWMVGFGTLTAVVPVLVVLLIALSLLANRNLIKVSVGLVLIGLFVIGSVGTAVTVVPLVNKFSSRAKADVVKEFDLHPQLLSLNFNELDETKNGNFEAQLHIQGWNQKTIKLVEHREARGKSFSEAKENAGFVQYNVIQQDSSLIFDSHITLDQDAPYRFQNLDIDLYIPYGQAFKMDAGLGRILRNTLHPYDFEESQLEGNLWMYNEKGLNCITCEKKNKDDDEDF